MRQWTLGATTGAETPVFFDASGRKLFGIFTRPTVAPLGVTIIVLTGGATPVSVNRNRLSVRFCRTVATLGYHALRFDYHGIGESEGDVDGFLLSEPFVEDLMGAVGWVRQKGLDRFVLVGHCFGGRTALSSAPDIDGLCGLALLAAPPRDFDMSLLRMTRRAARLRVVRGLIDPDLRRTYATVTSQMWRQLTTRVRGSVHGAGTVLARGFLEPLTELTRRGVPVLLLYGEEDGPWREVQRARAGPLGELLEGGRTSIELAAVPGHVHSLRNIAAQDAVMDNIISWLGRRVRPSDSVSWRANDRRGSNSTDVS